MRESWDLTGPCRTLAVIETNLVGDTVCACIFHLHHHICMQEVGLDHIWYKGCVFLLEHDGYNVVAFVPLPLQLGGNNS